MGLAGVTADMEYLLWIRAELVLGKRKIIAGRSTPVQLAVAALPPHSAVRLRLTVTDTSELEAMPQNLQEAQPRRTYKAFRKGIAFPHGAAAKPLSYNRTNSGRIMER
jgi:hypothetical protein